jgi:hypothetical protein
MKKGKIKIDFIRKIEIIINSKNKDFINIHKQSPYLSILKNSPNNLSYLNFSYFQQIVLFCFFYLFFPYCYPLFFSFCFLKFEIFYGGIHWRLFLY